MKRRWRKRKVSKKSYKERKYLEEKIIWNTENTLWEVRRIKEEAEKKEKAKERNICSFLVEVEEKIQSSRFKN